MKCVTTPSFFRTWTWLAACWTLATVLGPRGAAWLTSALDERLERVTRETCEGNGGTVVSTPSQRLGCVPCAFPRAVEKWP